MLLLKHDDARTSPRRDGRWKWSSRVFTILLGNSGNDNGNDDDTYDDNYNDNDDDDNYNDNDNDDNDNNNNNEYDDDDNDKIWGVWYDKNVSLPTSHWR